MIFFTSDNHFGHANILKFGRTFRDLDHMHKVMISNWNKLVKDEDTVIVVGDFDFLGSKERLEILNQLNGKKILVQGNHDRNKICPRGFDLMVTEMSIWIAGFTVSVKHYPLRYVGIKRLLAGVRSLKVFRFLMPFFYKKKPRYLDRMIFDKGQWHIHGHTHSKNKYNGKQIHVGVDAWDFKPVSIKEIESYIMRNK